MGWNVISKVVRVLGRHGHGWLVVAASKYVIIHDMIV
jgi:hypothetical protein